MTLALQLPSNARTASSERLRVQLPYETKKTARSLLDQQLWCMGCDLRASGRWFLEYPGMRPVPRPPGIRGSARVAGTLGEGFQLSLWGFGVGIAHETLGAVFLRRYGFFPQMRPAYDLGADCWSLKAMPRFSAPRGVGDCWACLSLLTRLAEFFAEYEAWLTPLTGEKYRENCLNAWHRKGAGIPAGEMAATWRGLGEDCRRLSWQLS